MNWMDKYKLLIVSSFSLLLLLAPCSVKKNIQLQLGADITETSYPSKSNSTTGASSCSIVESVTNNVRNTVEHKVLKPMVLGGFYNEFNHTLTSISTIYRLSFKPDIPYYILFKRLKFHI